MGWGPILSRLRKLEAITYKIIKEEIPIIYDIETDDLYLKGMEKGMELQEKKQLAEKVQSAKRLIALGLLTDKQIADALGEQVDFVRKVKSGKYD